LEERVGERRPIIMLDAAVCGATAASCRVNISDMLAENDDLLSLPLSSRGGEGIGSAASEYPGACKEEAASAPMGAARTSRTAAIDTT
jgi:hypothetical protein